MVVRALVVGGTSGIGYGLACRLAADPATTSVIISGRTKPSSLPHPNMSFRALDATSMRGIKSYADAFKASEEEKLDYLVMSQGVLTLDGRNETPEGIDKKMAVHYYGRQMLIRELLPSLAPDAKIISVYDCRHGNPDKLDWDDLDLRKNFSLGTAANHCMVMNDAMVQYFATAQDPGDRRHFIHAFPGFVNTNVARELPWYFKKPWQVVVPIVATKPETFADIFLGGIKERVVEGENEGKLWHYLDQKGRRLNNKKIWTEEEMGKIASHTWGLLDAALTTKE